MKSPAFRLFWLVVPACLAAATTASGADTPAAPAATQRRAPNILFAIADDWSYGHAGAYGSTWVETPAFDRVAREGLLFTHAYTPNAKCAPSRSCLLTGRNSWQLKDACNHICFFPPEFKTYTDVLADHGYYVGYTGKGWGPGVAKDAAGKPRAMTGKPFSKRKTKPSAKGISGNDYAGNFADFLDEAPADQPWCFWFGTTEPHRGYEFGVGASQGGKRISQIEHVPAFWPDDATIRQDMLDYAFEVEHFDRHLQRILAHLEAAGQLEQTLVVATSDHGMPFPRCKGQAYDYSNHVPLAVMWPAGIAAPGRTVDDYVSFIDVAPTFLDVAGVSWSDAGMASTPGQSWRDLFAAKRSGQVNPRRDHVLVGKERHDIGRPHDWGYPIRGIFKGDMLYLRNFEVERWPAGNPETGYLNCDGGPTKTEILKRKRINGQAASWAYCFGKRPAEELYDVAKDPDCVNNLAEREAFQAVKRELAQQLTRELTEQQDPRTLGQRSYFDAIPYANPGTRNFYERYLRGEKLSAGWVNPSDFASGVDQP